MLLYQLSYVRSSLGDWNRTSDLVDPNHALSLLSYTQIKNSPCQMARDDLAAVTPHGGPDRRSGRGTPPANRTLHALIWTESSSQTVAYEEPCVPLRGFEPQPSFFAETCPILGTVA